MNCRDVQRMCLERAREPLPDEVQRHVAACPSCLAARARADQLVGLLALKRHEQPGPGFDTRMVARVCAAVQEPQGWGARLWSVFESTPAPAWRYTLATFAVVLVGVNVVTFSLREQGGAASFPTNTASVLAAMDPEPVLEIASTNPAPEPYSAPVFVFEPPSNRRPFHPGSGARVIPVGYRP